MVKIKKNIASGIINGINLIVTFGMQLEFISIVTSKHISDTVFLIQSFGMFVISIFSSTLGVFLIEAFISCSNGNLKNRIRHIYKSLKIHIIIIIIIALLFSWWLHVYRDVDYKIIYGQLIIPICIFHISILASFYQSNGKYVQVEIFALISSVISVVLIFVLGKINIKSDFILSLIFTLRVLINLILLHLFVKNKDEIIGNDIKFEEKINNQAKKIINSSAIFKSEIFIDRFVVSFMPDGILSVFHMMLSFANGCISIFSRIVTIPMNYKISSNKEKINDFLSEAFSLLIKLVYILMFGLLIAGFFLWIYERVALDDKTNFYLLMSGSVFLSYMFMAANQIYSVGLYSIGNSATAIKVGYKAFATSNIIKIFLMLLLSFNGYFMAIWISQGFNFFYYKRAMSQK